MSLQDAVELAVSYSPPCDECAMWRARVEGLAAVVEAGLTIVKHLSRGDLVPEDQRELLDLWWSDAEVALARLPRG